MIYNYAGNKILNDFADDMTFESAYDATSHTYYTVLRIAKQRRDGTMQFPFARVPGGTQKTAYELEQSEPWELIINAGLDMTEGLYIENGIVIRDTAADVHVGLMPLTIDSNGDLGYEDADTTGKGASYVANGIVSAVCGFFPIIENYEDYSYPTDIYNTDTERWQHAQRQIIGQYGNGDYCIITSEGRNFHNSVGLTMTDAQRVCKGLGLKFAYNLDGGGSTELMIKRKMVNLVYEGTTGRVRDSFIVFNGTTTFQVPQY